MKNETSAKRIAKRNENERIERAKQLLSQLKQVKQTINESVWFDDTYLLKSNTYGVQINFSKNQSKFVKNRIQFIVLSQQYEMWVGNNTQIELSSDIISHHSKNIYDETESKEKVYTFETEESFVNAFNEIVSKIDATKKDVAKKETKKKDVAKKATKKKEVKKTEKTA